MNTMDEVKQILSRSLFIPADKIPDDAKIIELKGFDSLGFESIIFEMEETCGVEIQSSKLIGIETVADMANLMDEFRPQPANAIS